ncbi:MAG: TonB-dependent receptor [Deltaproteobacteria bacterium]|nr:TonB-dependent receptor [Deltaproteobacteria bacterium]
MASARPAAKRIEDVSLEELLQPVVTASRYEQRQQDAPSAVSLVMADEIQRYGYLTLGELLASLRGVYVTDDRNYSYLGMRGFGLTGDYNTRALLLVDGQRANTSVYDSASVGLDFPVDLDLIERVELVRGPSSSLYGSNAFFGVINVLTKPAASVGASASVGLGSLGTYRAAARFGRRVGPVDLLVSATYGHRDGQRWLYYREFDDPSTRNGMVEKQDAEDWAQLFASTRVAGLSATGAFGWRRKRVPTASFGTIFGDPSLATIDAQGYAALRYQKRFRNGFELDARASFNHSFYDGDYPYDRRASETDPPLRAINRDTGSGSWWGTDVLVSHPVTRWLKLSGGGELRHEFRQNQDNYDAEPRVVQLERRDSTTLFGAFAQADLTPHRRVSVTGGVRYDHYVGPIGGSLSPRGAVIVSPWSRAHLKLLVGSAFRAPSAYERFYAAGDPAQGDAQLGNPDLGPERIQTYEAVLEQHLGRYLRGQLGGYYYRAHELIRLATLDALRNVRFTNLDTVHAYGLEAELEGRIRGVHLRVSYAAQRTHDVATERPLENSPAHLAQLNLSVPLYRDNLFVSLAARYVSRRTGKEQTVVLGHSLVDLTLLSRELPKGLVITACVRNLLDARYFHLGGAEHVQSMLEQNGRTFWLKADYRLW